MIVGIHIDKLTSMPFLLRQIKVTFARITIMEYSL